MTRDTSLQARERESPGWNTLVISPLNLAARLDQVQMARALLDGGADVHGILGFAWRLIHQAARRDTSTEMTALLLDRGANIGAEVSVDPGDTFFIFLASLLFVRP